jgi:hypothetical protein
MRFVHCTKHLPPNAFLCLGTLLLALTTTHLQARAGPPFRTDDPETPGNRHWEINLGWIGDRNPYEGYYSAPNFDINYGFGDRIQLKYELPIAIHELRGGLDNAGQFTPPSQSHVDTGLGESLLGIKWRFYEHLPANRKKTDQEGKEETPEPNFSIAIYPQLSLNIPHQFCAPRGRPPGPQFLFPITANTRIGPIRFDAEFGYWFTNRNVPQSWIRGLIVGRDFSPGSEAYIEIYDQQDANRVEGATKQREATLGAGGRQALKSEKNILLLLMGGRSFQKVTSSNGQPGWIAYIGVQFLLGPRS